MKKSLLNVIIALLLMVSASSAKPANTAVTNFNDVPISAGNKVWYSSVLKVNGSPTYPLVIYLTNQNIKSDAFCHSVPNAVLILDPAVTVATTVFNGTTWVTTARPNEQGRYFISGYNDSLTATLPGCVGSVSWTGTFTSSRAGVSLQWQTAASVYTSLSANLNSLGIKPSDCSTCSFYKVPHSSGTPENFSSCLVAGATGGGDVNYTGDFSPEVAVSPEVANANTYVCEGNTIAINPGTLCSNWTSSDPTIATVSNDGAITGVAAGTVMISYLLTGYPVWQSVPVNVNAAPKISVISRPRVLYAGATLNLNIVTNTDGGFSDDAVFTWHGPDGFTSSLQNPTRPDMTIAMDGVYRVSVSEHGCTTTAKTASLKFSKLPAAIAARLKRMRTPRANYIDNSLAGGTNHTLLWDISKMFTDKKERQRATSTGLAVITGRRMHVKKASYPVAICGVTTMPTITALPVKFKPKRTRVFNVNIGVAKVKTTDISGIAKNTSAIRLPKSVAGTDPVAKNKPVATASIFTGEGMPLSLNGLTASVGEKKSTQASVFPVGPLSIVSAKNSALYKNNPLSLKQDEQGQGVKDVVSASYAMAVSRLSGNGTAPMLFTAISASSALPAVRAVQNTDMYVWWILLLYMLLAIVGYKWMRRHKGLV